MSVDVSVSVDGVPVSGIFFERLVSLTVTDREGIGADALTLVFSDAAPHFQSPRRGAVVSVSIVSLDRAASFVGSYVVDRVSFHCAPYTISVGAHSADLRSSLKAKKSRHWDDIAVSDLVARIAGEHGLTSKVSPDVSSHVYDWIGQQDESDLNFLDRLSKRHGALFTIKGGVMLWLSRGAGLTASGLSVPPAVVPVSSLVEGTCVISETDVDRFKTVKAFYHNRAGAARGEVVVAGDPVGESEHVMRDPYSSEGEARAAASSYVREMLRGMVTASASVVGNPSLMAGQPLAFVGVRPNVDGRLFITELVQHSYSKGAGLVTKFQAKLKAT